MALLAVFVHLLKYSDVASAEVEKELPGTMKNYAVGSMSISFTSEEAENGMGCDTTDSPPRRLNGHVSP